jgi:hypothetical protein
MAGPTGRKPAQFASGGPLSRNFHIVLAVLATLVLVYLVWFWYPTRPEVSPEVAAWKIFFVSAAALIYLAVQAVATIAQPVGSERRILVDLLFSAMPLIVFGYATLDWARGNLDLSVFQWMTLGLWGLTAAIDVIVFSLFSLRVIRRSPEISVGRGVP